MDSGSYDVIICGSGLQQMMLLIQMIEEQPSKTILVIDSNPYYGGDWATFNTNEMWKHFNIQTPIPPELGRPRDWNIDLMPKLLFN